VAALDDLSSANASFAWPALDHPSIRPIKGSIFDVDLIQQLAREYDHVVHFASVVGVAETIDRPLDTAANLTGTLNVARAMTSDHVLLFGSSADVYGMHSLYHPGPMKEDDHVVYEHALVNRWVYPKIKAVEESVVAASRARTVSVRIFNAYGPDMDFPQAKRVIPQFVHQILHRQPLRIHGSGRQVRSFCYYTDMVEGLARCLHYAAELPPHAHETMNIGDDRGISMLDLARMLVKAAVSQKLLDHELPVETGSADFYSRTFNDSWNRIPDLTRVQARLGFRPRVALEDGLALTLQGYPQNTARAGVSACGPAAS
jgi:nucleoside-diphosphate-sugar epimerase